MSYCRQCGGERRHSVLHKFTKTWSEEDAPIDGGDTWSTLECGGCSTITFAHQSWFSEEWEMTDQGPQPIIRRHLYPPSPARKLPEWGGDLYLCLLPDESWIVGLHRDLYEAIGIGAHSLAAMGARAIVDHVVTSRAGDYGSFEEKLKRLVSKQLITETHADALLAAFDAGSAAAHRGYVPQEQDVFILLDFMEALLDQIFLKPLQLRRQAEAAAALRLNTPQRPALKKP